MPLYFITGSRHKFAEIKDVITDIEQVDIDLDELQDIDPKKIIDHKLKEAFKHHSGPFIVEDTSLYLDCLNGLPGPLIKWFIKTVGRDGLVGITQKFNNAKATARTIIGYAKSKNELHFFEGEIHGKIVAPRGENGFGWDPIFQPEGHDKTFAEMPVKNMSMRRLATQKLREFLELH